jgi:hypothetical protein
VVGEGGMTDTRNEIESEQRSQRRQIREDAELLAGLMKHPGWPRYIALIEAVGQNFYHEAMMPLENLMLATKMEYAKGALKGLTLATSLPSAKIREASELTHGTDEE